MQTLPVSLPLSFPSFPLHLPFFQIFSSNNVKLLCTGSSLFFPQIFFPSKEKNFEVPVFLFVLIFLLVAIPSKMLDTPHVLSFQPFLKLSGWGEGGLAPWAFQPPSPPASQTSLSGIPQGQLLLSLGTPLRWRPVAINWPQSGREVGVVCVCIYVCVCACAVIVLFDGIHLFSPSVCFYSHCSHCFIPSHLSLGNHRNN